MKSILCDYRDAYAYILVSRTITVAEVAAGGGNNDIKLVFKNCTPLTDCMSEMSNTKIDNTKDKRHRWC